MFKRIVQKHSSGVVLQNSSSTSFKNVLNPFAKCQENHWKIHVNDFNFSLQSTARLRSYVYHKYISGILLTFYNHLYSEAMRNWLFLYITNKCFTHFKENCSELTTSSNFYFHCRYLNNEPLKSHPLHPFVNFMWYFWDSLTKTSVEQLINWLGVRSENRDCVL